MNRIIRNTAAAVLSAVMLAGCSSSAASTGSAASSSSGSSDSSVLRVGMECNYAPFNWSTTETNEYTQKISDVDYADGYDVVMAAKLSEAIGRKVEIVKLDWDNLILSLNNNQIDAIIAGMTDTKEREEEVSFTDPYYESEEVIIVKKDGSYANATSIQDFSGATVQGQMNTIYDSVIDQIDGVTHQPAAETFPSAIQALQSGAVDGVVSELPVADGVVAANSDLAIVRFADGKGFDADTTVSIAVRKADTDLRDQLNDALANIDTNTRNQLMEDAVERQPASEE